jgi:hypothetical protein
LKYKESTTGAARSFKFWEERKFEIAARCSQGDFTAKTCP